MRKKHTKVNFFLALALVICIPAVFTFFHYYSLSIADFLSFELKLEARDQISLPAVSDDKLKAFGLTSFNHLFFFDKNILELLSVIVTQISIPELTLFILRC
jgi:hypothetical protein